MRKKILLVGGLHKASALAHSLLKKGYDITIINENYNDCLTLAEEDSFKVLKGDGTKPFVLEDADAGQNEIAIALTQDDADNLVICELCKKKFKVKKTVALVNDPKKTEFFHRMGIDSVVCAINAITGIIEQEATLDKMETLIPIGEGNINIVQVSIPCTSPMIEKKIWEINLPKEVIIGCILRGEHSLIPRGESKILAGDVLVLISSRENQITAIKRLTGK